MIVLTWIVPVLIGLITFSTTNLDLVKICIATHTNSKWSNFATVLLFFTSIVVIYVLYGMIIFKYWGLKRKMSVTRKKIRGDLRQCVEEVQKGKVIAKKTQQILTFLKDSKYVICVISVFTTCWMPWILLVFYDITLHQSGSFQKSKEMHCGHFEAQHFATMQLITNRTDFLEQNCVHGLMSGAYLECEVPEEHVCEAVHENLHDYLIICLTKLCISFSVISSLINPILHGLWYPGFRQAVLYLTGFQAQKMQPRKKQASLSKPFN
eukprot:GFUD01081934.1.p1 GENE.GFUD01081934.1~~GFUD01081934.1.p1  ORF type:complete len:266 (-),score=14.54 GFUD01081934.1:16-813(-)